MTLVQAWQNTANYVIKRKVATMTRSEAIARLQKQGFAASPGRVRQAVVNGFVKPLPRKTARGAFNYKPRHLAQLRWYFVNIRPGPRPLSTEKLPTTGSMDRLHRLDRKRPKMKEREGSQRALRQSRKDFDASILWLEKTVRQLASAALEAPTSSGGEE